MNIKGEGLFNWAEVALANGLYLLCNYDLDKFDDEAWDEYLSYDAMLRKDTFPEDPVQCKTLRKIWLALSDDSKICLRWFMMDMTGKILARVSLEYDGEKSKTGQIYLDVIPMARNKGIGRFLLEMVVNQAKAFGVETLKSTYTTKAGAALFEKFDFRRVASSDMNRLYRQHINLDMLRDWSSGFEMERVSWIPHHMMSEYCALLDECLQMAYQHDKGFYEFENHTAAGILETQRAQAEQGLLPLICLIRHENKLVGVTQLYYYEMESWFVSQGLTGVSKDFQGRGYGKALKAYALLELLKSNPDFLYIETSNNIDNAPMNHINQRMGFRQYEGYKLVEKKI